MSDKAGEVAVSLHYDGEKAPVVSAKGEGELARQILMIATEHDIPIYRNKQLIQLLAQVELDSEIPRELYIAVAEIIAFAYRLKNKEPAPKASADPEYEAKFQDNTDEQ
ncbi:MAG: EscU/YscU/HrcU family type III secretion system export apparatus switch protein [Zhongshania sp.]|uniref:EscU/YscU/HrcU family type III secretion system export apparatus switch protein n=1 Tax=Zhongshania sp. TaxID=1971902 RepID=UPI00261EE226|nr:EscU/YscU/HrcU family type III secretion system export apparatus switch protein [Zhongshania sp.]MDF1694002.1 EscU/YscU/HrcU family type III secretion system export apparatus switch protein [Zhongshania sp.]